MMKNLVIFHFESMSRNLFLNNADCFPNICRFKEQAMSFHYYYSSATSTVMAINDLMYGEKWYRLEKTKIYGNERSCMDEELSLLDKLVELGYDTKFLCYPAGVASTLNLNLFFKKAEYSYPESYEDYIKQIHDSMDSEKFAIFVCDATEHLNHMDERKLKYENGYERRMQGYRSEDETFGHVWQILEESKKLKDTVILIYGDHGDDYWTHDLNSGFVHASLPYTSLTRTPLIIYDGEHIGDDYNSIVSTMDLYSLIFHLLNQDNHSYDQLKSRTYAFSRNLFANQKLNKWLYRLEKGYAIANRKYVLLLTNKGYEMYYVNLDVGNNGNLLDFFVKGKKGIRPFHFYDFMVKYAILHYHFFHLLNQSEIEQIQESFLEMRKELNKELDRIYALGIKKRQQIAIRKRNHINKVKKYRRKMIKMCVLGSCKRMADKFRRDWLQNEK